MNELIFASDNEALQYLSDITGKRIKVSGYSYADPDDFDYDDGYDRSKFLESKREEFEDWVKSDIVKIFRKSLPGIQKRVKEAGLPDINIEYKNYYPHKKFSVFPFLDDEAYFFIIPDNIDDFTDSQIDQVSTIISEEMNKNLSDGSVISFEPTNVVRNRSFGFSILNNQENFEKYFGEDYDRYFGDD